MSQKDDGWHYEVRCTARGCEQPAVYKIAARWTDGVLTELKTYALACREHVALLYGQASQRHAQHKPRPPEQLGPLTVYRWQPGKRDRELVRADELAAELGGRLEGGR